MLRQPPQHAVRTPKPEVKPETEYRVPSPESETETETEAKSEVGIERQESESVCGIRTLLGQAGATEPRWPLTEWQRSPENSKIVKLENLENWGRQPEPRRAENRD